MKQRCDIGEPGEKITFFDEEENVLGIAEINNKGEVHFHAPDDMTLVGYKLGLDGEAKLLIPSVTMKQGDRLVLIGLWHEVPEEVAP